MSTYQDVVLANGAVLAWALTESAGTDFVPYIGGTHLTGAGGGMSYRQTGPFAGAFGLQVIAGDSLRYPFSQAVFPPFTTEVWTNFSTLTPASSQLIFYAGNQAANGSGLYLSTTGHLHWYAGGVFDVDLGAYGHTGWNLVQVASPDNTHAQIFINGIQTNSVTTAASTAPTPNGQGWMSDDSSYNSVETCLLSYPAVYAKAFTANQAYASFVASTNPDLALQYILAGVGGTLPITLLNDILNSVRKIY